jgi:hypothetical protein
MNAQDAKNRAIEIGRKTQKLMDNDLFKEVILEAYMRDMALESVYNSGSDDKIVLDSIYHLKQWLDNQVATAKQLISEE